MTWDDGAPIDPAEVPSVLSRIQAAIESVGESLEFEISDEIYQHAVQDWERYGPTSPEASR
jgi:hypothetical protein